MGNHTIRYQTHPLPSDTVGFFDCCRPITNESKPPTVDSLKKFCDFGVYNYLTPKKQEAPLATTTSMFVHHSLAVKHKGILAIEKPGTDWVTGIFLICLILFAWVQASYPKRFQQMFRAAIQPYYVNQLEREGNLFAERITLGLGFIFYSIVSVFSYQLMKEFGMTDIGLNYYLVLGLLMAGFLLYDLIKNAMIYSLGVVFDTLEVARQYQLNALIFNHVMGVMLLPIVIVSFYWGRTESLVLGGLVVTLVFAYRLFRGMLIGASNKGYGLLYLFIYLCTLEILPLLLIYKVISKI